MAYQGSMLSKTLVIGIIFLFIGIGAFPTVSNSIRNKTGISLITIKVAGKIGLNNWYVNDVGFTFTNESSDIAEIKYGINSKWQTYTEPFNISEDGKDIRLEWYAVDYEGNQSEVDGPFFLNIDQTPPEIELDYEVIGGNHWQGSDILVTAHATDGISGMDRVEFYKNDILQKTVIGHGPVYQWQFKYHGVLNIFIVALAFDKAGNSDFQTIDHTCFPKKSSIDGCLEDVLSSEIVERKNDKVTEKLYSGSAEGEVFDPAYVIVVFNRNKMGENGWIISNVSVPIFYESDRIDKVYYQLNDGSWMLYSEPLVISEDGIYVFSWYVVDSEGYTSTPDSISFRIDRTPPEIKLKKRRLAIDKVKVIANVYDETSGIDKVKFKSWLVRNGNAFTDYDFPYEWIRTGLFIGLVSATVYDNAGNSASKSILFNPIRKSQQRISQQYLTPLFLMFLERFPFLEVFLRAMNLLR